MRDPLLHQCSRHPESCPSCGAEDTRDAFEGMEAHPGEKPEFVVRCPSCEVLHPDQSNHDGRECDPCADEWLEEDRRARERLAGRG